MGTSSNYIGIIMGILVFIVLSSGCVSISELVNNLSLNNTGNGTLSAYNVSFNYPSSWYAFTDNKTGSHTILVSRNPSNLSAPSFMVQIVPNPEDMSDQDVISSIQNGLISYGWTRISSTTLKINGSMAYQQIFRVNDSHYSEIMKDHQINIVKNGNTYTLDFIAPYDDFDKEKKNFDMILNSFKVQ